MATKPKAKKMTLDVLAAAIEQDFSAIRVDMTAGFRAVREMACKDDVADVRDKVAVAKEELREQIAGLRYAKEIDALRDRVKFVEEKLGIKHSHRSA